jgi:molybdopterin converting factor small subunit
MRIKLHMIGLPLLTRVIGKRDVDFEVAGNTVGDLVEEILARYGEKAEAALLDVDGKFNQTIWILLNEKAYVQPHRLNTILHPGDEVTLMIMMFGG